MTAKTITTMSAKTATVTESPSTAPSCVVGSKIVVLPGIDDQSKVGRIRRDEDNDESKKKVSKFPMKKERREYAFRIALVSHEKDDGGKETTTVVGVTEWRTFGELRTSLKKYESHSTSVPRFPHGSYWGTKDHVHNLDNAQTRANDLAEFIGSLFQTTTSARNELLVDDEFQDSLCLTEETREQCVATLKELYVSRKDYTHSMRDQHSKDREYAQNFNNMADVLKDPVPSLVYDAEQSFILRDLDHNQFGTKEHPMLPIFMSGDDDKKHDENNVENEPVFWWVVMNDALISTNDAQLFSKERKSPYHSAITNRHHEPLLLLKERYEWRNYYCELSRYMPDSKGSESRIVPICSVKCSWDLNEPKHPTGNYYRVKLLGPLSDTTKHKVIQTFGTRWPNQYTFGNKSLPTPFATCHKSRFAFLQHVRQSMIGGGGDDNDCGHDSLSTYTLTVKPGEDCLLFVGIASAIDRIHQAIEEETEHRNRENYM